MTVDGVTLIVGQNVPLSVVEVLKHEVEPATTQLRLTVEHNVKELQRNLRIVILTLVQVKYY